MYGYTKSKLNTICNVAFWQGFVFIDRDPKHFGVILNFLRDGFAVLPRDEQALREIMVEAAYYKVCRTLYC